jgi:aspartate aminotransferase-like enzyme
MVMLSERARQAIDGTTSSSFAADLKKWLQIMQAYEGGAHMYHATLPTDALTRLRETMLETRAYGFERLRAEQEELGRRVRALLESRGLRSVAAPGFKAPGVVVSHTDDDGLASSKAFLALAENVATSLAKTAFDNPEALAPPTLSISGGSLSEGKAKKKGLPVVS